VTDPLLYQDPVYVKSIRPLTYGLKPSSPLTFLSYLIAGLLPCAYFIGLLFTLKTHADIYNPVDDGGGTGEHDAPEWSRSVCIVILIISTGLLALVRQSSCPS
jgi:Ca2+/H+ antiporter